MQIFSSFLLVCSFILLGFVMISWFLGSFPFVLIISVAQNTARRFIPTKDDGTYLYGQILNVLGMLLSIVGIANAVFMRVVKNRRDADLCHKTKMFSVFNGIIVLSLVLIIFVVGILFFDRTTNAIEDCILTKDKEYKLLPYCKLVC